MESYKVAYVRKIEGGANAFVREKVRGKLTNPTKLPKSLKSPIILPKNSGTRKKG